MGLSVSRVNLNFNRFKFFILKEERKRLRLNVLWLVIESD